MKRVARLINLSYVHKMGYYGNGITVAVVDSGIAYHPALGGKESKRYVASADMVNGIYEFYDDMGHGTHVAGIIGGNNEHITGMAPECRFVSVKVLDKKGNGRNEDIIAGLNWIMENADRYSIRIVNISVGTTSKKEYDENSMLVRMVDKLWNNGLIVVAAAGNNGPVANSIGAPGISRKIITVGAVDDSNIKEKGMRDNYSGRGPTSNCIMKPDIVAPGSYIYSCSNCAYGHWYQIKSGTSMSTPVVTGAIALLLSKYPQMTNREVKIRLKKSAVDIGYPREKQGWGMLDVLRLME